MPAAGGLARNISAHPAQDLHPAFSPDGKRVAFVSDRGGALNVWIQPVADGASAGPAERLTTEPGFEYAPAWSPDGRTIAFTRFEGDSQGVWLARVDKQRSPWRIAGAPKADMLRWTSKGLYSAGRWGTNGITLRSIDLRSRSAIELAPPLVLGSSFFDISREGDVAAFVDRPARGDIWILDRGSVTGR